MNLKQLSESLGLSQTTVSRALNGYSDVNEATRERVVETAKRLGYKPNAMARRLAMGKADAVGLVYPLDALDMGDPRFLEVIEGLTDALNANDIDVLIASAGKANELKTYERLIRGHRVDGLIVARTLIKDPRIQYLRQAKFPFVSYGRTQDPSAFSWFDFDNELGCRLAVRRLVGFGHQHIAYIHASVNMNFARQRYEGFMAEMREAALPVNPDWVKEAGFAPRSGYDAMRALLAAETRPTAIVVDNNLAGVGVLQALYEAGLKVGEDCSVIVYDGVPQTVFTNHSELTFVEQATPYEAGKKLAELIQGVMQGKPLSELQVLWKPSIRAGHSDGPVGPQPRR